jgi:FMN reductase
MTARVLALHGSPNGGGHTEAAVAAVAAAAAAAGAAVETIGIADDAGTERALAALPDTDAVVLGSPVYRASFATPLKRLLDLVPRTNGVDPESPLAGKPVAIVHTGASLHHFTTLDTLRNVLAGFFAAHVVPPGLYVPRDGFDDDLALVGPYATQASLQGTALVELVNLLDDSLVLRTLRPQA